VSGDPLMSRIVAEIEDDGPMRFDRFMEIALYDPELGYFTTGSVRSEKDGDFLTSPEVSPLFGETVARFVADERDRIGEPFTVIEVGAGTGSLLRPLLDALDRAPAAVHAIEVSAPARERLRSVVPEAAVSESMDALPARVAGVVIANELLDNLPAAVAVRRGDAWGERAVVCEDDRLATTEIGARPEVAAWAEVHAGPVGEGAVVEVQMAVTGWIRDALSRLDRGAVVVIDYGDTAEGLERRRSEGTLRTYRGHHLGPDPLLEPGRTDITMDVNVTAVVAAAESAGADVSVHRQDEFLEGWGLRDAIADLRAQELDAARKGDTVERLRLRSSVTDAEALLHPRGLGDFRVVVARK
jgi:SAM-dependent MidA family methyltransferase